VRRGYAQWAPVVIAVAAAAPGAHGDGGQVQFSGAAGPYQVTVFTQPVPLRAGPADFSALVQDPRTGDAVLDGRVRIDLTRAAMGETISATLSRAAATNKLLRAATVDLPAAGEYHATVTVASQRGGAARAVFDVQAAPGLPPWRSLLFWICWPAVPIVLYVWHTVAAGRRAPIGQGVAST
jgi:hypothetical protein